MTNGFRSEDISVFSTNENYAYFTDACLVRGAFFNEKQIDRKLPLAVLNETAAYRIFGSKECIGESVYLNGVSYEVCGIMGEPEESGARLYIPCSTIALLGISEPLTDQIWCRFSNLAEAALVLGNAGYSLEALDILQMDSVKCVFWQRFFCPLILLGIYAVFCICRSVSKNWNKVMHDDSIGKNWMKKTVLQILGAFTGIFLVFMMFQMAWCAPPAYELSGGSWRTALYGILDFYLLVDVHIRNIPFFVYWNFFSGISSMVCLCLMSLFILCHR